jgi:glycosyltransferase involved in cell wall biosynthesis
MEVVFDCDILRNRKTGVENYTLNILRSLSKHISLTLLHNNDIVNSIFHGKKQIITKMFRFPLSRFVYSIFFPIKPKADIIHLPTPTAPFWNKPKDSKLIVTVHDLTPYKYPEFHTLRRKIYYKFIVRHLLEQADIIITDSNSTMKDLKLCFGIKSSKVRVIPLAADLNHTSEKVPAKYGIKEDYILYVGTVEPRKNLIRLIKAYNELRPKEKLVIVGCSGWNNKEIYKQKNENVIFTDYVPSEDLNKFYSNAKIFVYPSLYEGFGIPILEAMKCKVPVITSNTSSMPEVAGDAALLIDPTSVNEIKNAMSKLLKDKKLRDSLVKKGIKQAAKFSWDKTAKETIKVYNECYSSR